MVTISKKKWQQKNIEWDEATILQLVDELDASRLFVEVCMQRGLTTAEEIKNFLTIDESWFHDPFLMFDMEKAISRIMEAIENLEQITIYGDYDADGMTSTALLTETLESLGANVNYYLPSRFVEGYGPNVEAFEKIISEGTTLIVTVDNGVAGHDAIKHANELGADVIVTDHHELPNELPDAYAIVHPNHPEGNYPFKELAGVGVALKVTQALLGELPVEILDLAAIGTVADLVPLVDENRAIVYFGLKMLEQTQRMGLLQLLSIIGKKPEEVNEETIGFQIAPRLNAVGRLGEATPCVELLMTHDPEKAQELATYVDAKNEERKAIVEQMTTDVKEKLKADQTDSEVVVLADESWHQGVLGIVASRVVEHTNKPTLLFTIDKETRVAKGSARSIEGFNLYEAFQKLSELFVQFGGHSMAAGMRIEVNQLDTLRVKLSELIREMSELESIQRIDASVPLAEITNDSIKELMQLRPFGTGNEKPVIASEQVSVLQKRSVGLDGNHLKLLVGQENEQLDIISFQNGYISDRLYENQEVSVAGYPELNEWNGTTKPQLQMIDLSIPGPILIDKRLNQLEKEHFQNGNTVYVFYESSHYKAALNMLPDTSKAIYLKTIEEAAAFISDKKEMVIVDCPPSIESFKQTIAGNEKGTIRCYFYKKNHLFLSGLPTRADFTKAYKFFATHRDIDLVHKGNELSQQLNLDNNKIFLIVKVFLEANFVIINSGVLNVVEHPEKQDILKTKSYQKAQEQMKAEELFIYSSFNEMITAII